MTIIVNATFVNGQFQPVEPLSLPEGAEVQLTVTPVRQKGATRPVHRDDDISLEPVIGIGSSRSNMDHGNRPDAEPLNEDDPLEAVIGICSSGGGKNLAEDHDLYLYGPLRKPESKE